MRVALSCIGKFHHFDLARQLQRADRLAVIYTGYPRWKLKNENLPAEKIVTFPWLQTIYMAQRHLPVHSARLVRFLGEAARRAHDRFVAARLKKCDVFVGLSGHNLHAGRRAKALGAKWICDRASTHICHQEKTLRDEYARWGIQYDGIPWAVIEQEKREYAEADAITVPSRCVAASFTRSGVAADKLRRIAYGVDLSKFFPVDRPAENRFDIVFIGGVSLRKGIPYLIEGYRQLGCCDKTLTIIGSIDPALRPWLRKVQDQGLRFTDALPQSELKQHLSRSHVFVLPSVEEGMAYVQAQALACACPVICSDSTGGDELITPGVEGFIVPTGSSAAIADKLRMLATQPQFRQSMSERALARVKHLGGWDEFGQNFLAMLDRLVVV